MCTIEVKGVQITLTEDQIRQIDAQRGNFTHFTQIKSYEDACKVLKRNPRTKEQFGMYSEWYFHQIRIIRMAINSLIQIKGKFPNWKDSDQAKHYPYFRDNGGGLVFYFSSYYSYCCYVRVVYFKSKEASDYMGTTFVELYRCLGEEEM